MPQDCHASLATTTDPVIARSVSDEAISMWDELRFGDGWG